MILRITEAHVLENHTLVLSFNDGTVGMAEVEPLLDGPIFEPLRDPDYFARMELDPVCGTVTWPNGADFAPEALYDLVAAIPPEPRR